MSQSDAGPYRHLQHPRDYTCF